MIWYKEEKAKDDDAEADAPVLAGDAAALKASEKGQMGPARTPYSSTLLNIWLADLWASERDEWGQH